MNVINFVFHDHWLMWSVSSVSPIVFTTYPSQRMKQRRRW